MADPSIPHDIELVKPIETIYTNLADPTPLTAYIESKKPIPNAEVWKPKQDTTVFRFNDSWVVSETRHPPEGDTQTQLYVRDQGDQVYVLWRELKPDPDTGEESKPQTVVMIFKGPDGKTYCVDGENKPTNTDTTLHYVNSLLTYAFP